MSKHGRTVCTTAASLCVPIDTTLPFISLRAHEYMVLYYTSTTPPC